MSIGEVLAQLRPDFPDITISKIRFLEAEGLVEPERTASGYRKFSHEDVARLRYVLTAAARPLPAAAGHQGAPRRDRPRARAAGPARRAGRRCRARWSPPRACPAPTRSAEVSEIRLSREELRRGRRARRRAARPARAVRPGARSARAVGHYDADALVVAKTVAEMARFGIEARHLRAFKDRRRPRDRPRRAGRHAAGRQRNPEARARAEEVARELGARCRVRLHATLVAGRPRRAVCAPTRARERGRERSGVAAR